MISADAARLIAVMAAFYLHDAAILLYANEGVIYRTREKWEVHFGTDNFSISGRALFFLMPFYLHRPLFRLTWYREAPQGAPNPDFFVADKNLRQLAPLAYASALTQFVLLPAMLFFSFSIQNLIFVAALIYAYIALSVCRIYFEKDQFGLTRKQLLGLAVECFFCPPIAINIIQRISLAQSNGKNCVEAARLLFRDAEWVAIQSRMENSFKEGVT